MNVAEAKEFLNGTKQERIYNLQEAAQTRISYLNSLLEGISDQITFKNELVLFEGSEADLLRVVITKINSSFFSSAVVIECPIRNVYDREYLHYKRARFFTPKMMLLRDSPHKLLTLDQESEARFVVFIGNTLGLE